ncbi:uncharacterized protein B0I36DRAFT_135351 [Microdochium trichocladiopsis]|uniref:Hydrophobic surface binding protein A-domain-containing protein n=1 Tax=Microdochium trichocladiopsis TaxID=1682393 RepID=A0A9P9BMN6_9PEZI|nr:uncharacterized protein B0I36DRAFT_135351 [Microdochium trichocladiopsis]KAH7029798.1 hypothetical protein B0I36DRAFT_135351 [Microdochium trichocladiopsis]
MRFSIATAAIAGLAAASPMVKTRQTGVNVVDETLQVVDSAANTIVTQLTDINFSSHVANLLLGTLTGSIVPQLEESLTAVGDEFVDIKNFVTSQLKETVAPVVEAELGNVVTLLEDTTDLVNEAKSTLESLTSGLLTSTLSGVKQEAQYLLDTIEPAIAPVLEISKDFVGTATGSVVDQINSLTADLKTLATEGLAPVQDAINKLV